MGLITFIRHTMPQPIEAACKHLKMKDEVVKRLYAAIPSIYKNKYHYREGIKIVNAVFDNLLMNRTSIYNIIDMSEVTSCDMERWFNLDNEIKKQIEYAR